MDARKESTSSFSFPFHLFASDREKRCGTYEQEGFSIRQGGRQVRDGRKEKIAEWKTGKRAENRWNKMDPRICEIHEFLRRIEGQNCYKN